jgi:putative transposase
LILLVVVHAGNVQDRDGAKFVLGALNRAFARLRVIWADGGYAGALVDWTFALRKYGRIVLTIVRRSEFALGFELLPKRWVVERTFAWLGRYRRHSKDYELLPESSESMIYVSMINLMTARLARVSTS